MLYYMADIKLLLDPQLFPRIVQSGMSTARTSQSTWKANATHNKRVIYSDKGIKK